MTVDEYRAKGLISTGYGMPSYYMTKERWDDEFNNRVMMIRQMNNKERDEYKAFIDDKLTTEFINSTNKGLNKLEKVTVYTYAQIDYLLIMSYQKKKNIIIDYVKSMDSWKAYYPEAAVLNIKQNYDKLKYHKY